MTETIKSTEVVKPETVGSVAPETSAERKFRIFCEVGARHIGALLIVIAGFVALILIICSDSAHFDHFRDGAFAALITMIGGAAGFLFGSNRKNDN